MRLGPRAIGSAIALVRLAKLHDRSNRAHDLPNPRIRASESTEARSIGFHIRTGDRALSAGYKNFGAMMVENLEGLAFASIR